MTSNSERHAMAADRLQLALDSIDEAQSLVERAARALAGTDSMSRERKRLACLSNRMLWAWIGVRAAANRLQHAAHPAPHRK
jgi:hypothetical protein